MLKILGSILLIYEPLAYMFFVKKHFCEDIFYWQFCTSNMLDMRVLLFMILPIVISILCVMWFGALSKRMQNTKPNKIKKSEKLTKITPKTKQKMVSPIKSICNYWARIYDINGRAQRSEYWVATVFWTLFFVIMMMLTADVFRTAHPECFTGYVSEEHFIMCLKYENRYNIVGLIPFIPQLTLNVRRWHDLGFSGLLALIPIALLFISPAIFIVFIVGQIVAFCFPSKTQNNAYDKTNSKTGKTASTTNKSKTYGWQDWD